MNYAWGITTSTHALQAQAQAALALANVFHVPYLDRDSTSLRELREAYHLDVLVTLDKHMGLSVDDPPLHWHPSVAIPRLRRLAEGGSDNFLAATALEEGDKVLDCTLGLGADAIVAAHAVGDTGMVTGLEASPVIALLTAWGLRHEAVAYHRKKAPLGTIAGRIRVIPAEALAFLEAQADGSWDVICFDPMFRTANPRSSAINSYRSLACHAPFTAAVLSEALRVCVKRVVLKERWFSPLFAQLGADKKVKARYGPVAYGIWEKGKAFDGEASLG